MARTHVESQGKSELIFLALGGLGEIGMNCYLYGLGPERARKWLMVDLGITFPEGEFDPGVDVIMPDLRFIEARAKDLCGLVLTHAHEDHFGAVIELWPRIKVPVYATPFTATMLKTKLAEQTGGQLKIPIHEVALGARFDVGPFSLELVNQAHSIPEPNGLAIRTPHGLVYHSGDWKLDSSPGVGLPPDEKRIKELGDEGVLALICDSTNAMRDGHSPSEEEVAASLARIVKRAEQCVILTTFASNVARVLAVAKAAHASGRRLVVAGRALHRVIQVAIETGYLPPDFMYADQQRFSDFRRNEVVALVTGSQGEPRAALARIADNAHPDISIAKGDLVIFSSRTIPGNERDVGRIQNALVRLGAEILTDNEALVHVTGHPRRDELKRLYGWIKPRILVPMHGEMRHLSEHAKLARAAGIKEVVVAINGEAVVLAPGRPAIVDEVPVGRLYRDGNMLINAEDMCIRERRKLAFVGVIVVSLVLSRNGKMLDDPEVVMEGVPSERPGGGAMEDMVLDVVEGTIESIPPARRRDTEMVREAVRRAVRASVDQVWGKKSVVRVMVSVLDVKG
ncbi:MAG: ribonuclease J [Hyphomicrobiaceae bacterium]